MAIDSTIINYFRTINGTLGVNSKKDFDINSTKQYIIDNFETIAYENVLINGINRDVQITTENNEIILLTKPNEIISLGNLVTWNSESWLCTLMKPFNKIYYTGVIEKCNHIIKFYKNKTLYSLPCIKLSGSGNYLGEESNKYFSVSSGRYIVLCQAGIITKKDINLRFMINDSAYKINGIDDSTMIGIIKMELQDDNLIDDDNKELGICNYYSNQPIVINDNHVPNSYIYNYKIDILPNTNKLILGKKITLTSVVFDNEVQVNNKHFVWSITPNGLASIEYNDNTCMVTAINLQSAVNKTFTIKVALSDNPSVYTERVFKITNLV